MPDERDPFPARSLQQLQDNIRRAGPAATAGYSLIGAILLLGGAGHLLDRWQETEPWVALVATAGAVAVALVPGAALEVLLGMAGPIVVGVGSLVLTDRTYKRSPERLTRLMVRAFLGKLVVFGLYMTAAVNLLALDAIWFAGSFTAAFVVLHLAEALHLQRLFTT